MSARPLLDAIDRITAITPAQQWLLDQTAALARIKAQTEAETEQARKDRLCVFCAGETDGFRPYCDFCDETDV